MICYPFSWRFVANLLIKFFYIRLHGKLVFFVLSNMVRRFERYNRFFLIKQVNSYFSLSLGE